ncbi:unnamed protein product [Hymenolepis diminuta]|uniref:EGF-like domain-containing protein n=1 Tax=Hymenolepis diminuta TaxID=6216 RepID=A0A158QDH6_HYMDI|nr:unnamed protein product [Hymenolepis diminuta]
MLPKFVSNAHFGLITKNTVGHASNMVCTVEYRKPKSLELISSVYCLKAHHECPLDCSGHGHCVKGDDGHYFCQCFANRKGSACQVSREVSYGLIDCLDPDCCGTDHCEKLIRLRGNLQQVVEDARQSCAHSTEISSLILSTKLASPGSSFYDQLEFLLLRDLTTDKVDPRRVSVVRGVVRQWDSTPFWGCRVFDRLNPVIGSALTDKNGRFELVVDGGFLVQLEFIRHPTSRFTAQLDVYVPVNHIVNIGDFYLMDRSASPLIPAPPLSKGLILQNFHEGAVTGVGGILPASPIFGDLWVAGLLPSVNPDSPESLCPPDVHDISRIGGPIIEPNARGFDGTSHDDLSVCFDSDESLCVSREGVLFYRYALKPTNLYLVQSSDKTMKSPSFIVIKMLSSDRPPPDFLNEVHLSIDVAGLRQSWRFEPSQGLEFTYIWNRTDGYNRSVYGRVPAKVSVGFLYGECPTVFWEHRVVHIDGHDITSIDLPRWNLNARHTYAPNQGIVYMGDGRSVSVGENLVVALVLGKPNVRRLANRCEMCLGRARGNPIFRVAALSTDETGRLIVVDGYFIRYLHTEIHRQAFDPMGSFSSPYDDSSPSIPENGAQSPSASSDWLVADVRPMSFVNGGSGEADWPAYYIARHPISSEELEALSRGGIGGGRAGIFISDTNNRTIWWTSLARRDFSQMVISELCPPNETMSDCLRMPLTKPKGLVVTYNEDLFFIDDKRLWRYQLRRPPGQKSSRMELVIGQSDGSGMPMSCERSLPANKVQLTDPTFIAYNPVEDCLYYVDDKRVYRLHLASRMISLAAGKLPGCKPYSTSNSNSPSGSSPSSDQSSESAKAPFAVDVEFSEIRGIAFSSMGELYIGESDVIWIRRSDGRLHLFAGTKSTPAWNIPQGTSSRLLHPSKKTPTYSQINLLVEHPAIDFQFVNITSISVGIFDEVFVADSGHNVVFAVRSDPPKLGKDGRYSIKRSASETQIFNKQGQLEGVIDTLTQQKISSFTFTANGWLSTLRIGPSELAFKISPLGFPQQIVLNTGETHNLTLAPMFKGFGSIISPFGGICHYEYSDHDQLRKIWTISVALPYVATYSPTNSLLTSVVLPSGWTYSIQKNKDQKVETDLFGKSDSREISMTSSPNGEIIKLMYSEGAQEVIFERLEPQPSSIDNTANHASWQIGRRIRMYVQPQSSDNLLNPNSNSDNSSVPSPRLIENLVMSSFDVFGVITQDFEIAGSAVRQRRFSWQPERSASSLYLGRERREMASDTIQKTRKTLSINGQPILSVTLDRELLTETFRSPSTDRLLLQIVYNGNMQPTLFTTQTVTPVPKSGFVDLSASMSDNSSKTAVQDSTMAPLRNIYTREGQLKEAFWGVANYRLSYDSTRRLRTAEIGSTLNTLVFDYQNPNLPYLVSH